MSFENKQQFKIPFEEPIKEVADVSVLSEAEGKGYGVPKEEIKKETEIKKPKQPEAIIIKLTDKQVKEREDDLKYKKEIGNREHGF